MRGIIWVMAFVAILSIYANTNAETYAQIQQQQSNSSNIPISNHLMLDLLNETTFRWSPVNYAKLSQSNDTLDIIVETDNTNKVYNRASLQTQLNSTSNEAPPLILSLIYSFKSMNGSADIAVEVRDRRDNSILASYELDKNSTTGKFPLPQNITNKPIEFRLYIITDEPGFHILNTKHFDISKGNNTISKAHGTITTTTTTTTSTTNGMGNNTISKVHGTTTTTTTTITTTTTATTNSEAKAKGGEWNSYYQSLIFDEMGIPYYNYSYVGDVDIGLQRNPITIEHEALRFFDQYQKSNNPKNDTAKQFFINNADWLVNNTMTKQYNGTLDYGIYEYSFAWPDYKLKPPWQSGMAQGRALIVMVKAHEMTGEQKYLDTAKSLLNSFFVEVKDGGVASKTRNNGWWFEEYASTRKDAINGSRVLNGHIFAILGIHEYYKYTHDPLAEFLFDQGILALKNDLPKYDNNGDSFYDALGKKSSLEYQGLHVSQLQELFNLTGEAIFKQYHDKWSTRSSEQ